MRISQRYYSSIVLAILGGCIAKTQFVLGDGCEGFPDMIFFVFLGFLYFVLLLIFLAASATKHFNKKEKFNFLPLLTTVFVVLIVYLCSQADNFKSETVLFARAKNGPYREGGTLALRENQTFELRMQEIEWACYYKGDYKVSGDTIKLLRNDIQMVSDSAFAETYLLHKTERILTPLGSPVDPARWLTIEKGDK